jgi:hypothetical protein
MREGAENTGDITQRSTGFLALATGNTAQRPSSPINGMIRYNTDNSALEAYTANSWAGLPSGSFVKKTGDTMTGSLTMSNSAQFLANSGTLTAPAYSFASDSSTGMYNVSNGVLALVSNGTTYLTVQPPSTTSASVVMAGNAAFTSLLELRRSVHPHR